MGEGDKESGQGPRLERAATHERGVIVQTAQGTGFVRAEQALGFVESARTSPVPGATFSLLWFDGRVLVAVPFETCLAASARQGVSPGRPAVGLVRRSALVCECGGEVYALTGVEVVATGTFEVVGSGATADAVRSGADEVPLWVLVPPAFTGAERAGGGVSPPDHDTMQSGRSRFDAPGAPEEAEPS
jgi:hypothetical protein